MIIDISYIFFALYWEFDSAQGDLAGDWWVPDYQMQSISCIVDDAHYSSSLMFLPQIKIKEKKEKRRENPT